MNQASSEDPRRGDPRLVTAWVRAIYDLAAAAKGGAAPRELRRLQRAVDHARAEAIASEPQPPRARGGRVLLARDTRTPAGPPVPLRDYAAGSQAVRDVQRAEDDLRVAIALGASEDTIDERTKALEAATGRVLGLRRRIG